jgi:hypothetical protein
LKKPKGPSIFCPAPGCYSRYRRRKEWNRHILQFHLPYHLYCPNPACDWQGCRKEDLHEHIDEGNCGPRPKSEEQRVIYNTQLILGWIIEGVSTEVAQMFAVDLVEERARELGKESLWKDPWIKLVPQ